MAVDPANLPLLDAFTSGLAAGWSANELDTDSAGLISASGGQVLSASGGRTGYWATTYTKPMGARIKVATLPTSPMALWLVQTGNTATPTGYRLRYDPAGTADITVSRINAGGSTFLHGGDIVDHPISAGDEIAVTIDTDNTVTIHRYHSGAWSVVTSAVDSSALSGPLAPGLEINDTTFRGDDLRGGVPTSSTVDNASTGGGVGGGVAVTRAKAAASTGGAVAAGTPPVVVGDPPDAVLEVQFYQPHDRVATIRVRRASEQGAIVSAFVGRTTTPPATPTDDGWVVVLESSVSAAEVVTLDVPLPTNDDDYTLAVFGWDETTTDVVPLSPDTLLAPDTLLSPEGLVVSGVAATDPLLVEVFGAVSPIPLAAGSDYAAATIVTDRPATGYLRTSEEVDGGGDLDGTITTYDGGSGWRLLDPGDDPADDSAGSPLSGSWPAGSSGRIIRKSLPAATADRYLEWSNRVRPTP